jgi:hypothetical protein
MKPQFFRPRRCPPPLAVADRARMPWRFLARHVSVDGLLD